MSQTSSFSLPIGPVHVALEEPVYFHLDVDGETVRKVEITSGHVHRGMEGMATQRNFFKNTTLTERVCSLCSNSHSLTYCMAVENVLGMTPPPRAQYLRVLAEETKRVASHLFNIAIFAHNVGFKSLFLHIMEVRENMQDVKETIYGNRMNLSANCIGGVKFDMDDSLTVYMLERLDTVEEAVKLRLEHPEAQIIAGGTDVLVQMREGRRAGKELISIQKVNEIRGICMDEQENIRIGSLTTFSHITHDPIIIERINVLGEAVDMVGGPQIRNAGTIGGNTCNGVTSADSASTLHAWEAIIELTGVNGKRYLPIKDFYIKAGTVDINVAEGEIQTAVLIPKASWENTKGFYIKYGMRNAMEIATTGCSVNVRLSEDQKTFDRVRIAYGVAGPVPMRAPSAEAVVNGQPVTMENVEAFSRAVLEDINPRDSWRASKAFRKHIAVEMAKRALIESVKRCGGEI